MIQFTEHKDIDKAWWDETLEQCGNKLPYAYSWMLDAVAPGWNALIDKERGAIMPLPWRKKLGIKYVFAPFPLQQLGVFAKGEVSDTLVDEFLAAIPASYKKVDLQLNWKNCPVGKGYKIEEWTNLLVDLDRSLEKIRSGFSTNHKRNIKKFNASGAVLKKVEDPTVAYKAFEEWKLPDLDGQKIELENVRKLIEACEAKDAGVSYAIYSDGQLTSAAYFVTSMDRIIYLKGASNDIGKKSGAMHAIMDRVITDHSGQYKWLDFGGSNDPSLARFYKGFGATSSVYLHLVKDAFPGLVKRIRFRK